MIKEREEGGRNYDTAQVCWLIKKTNKTTQSSEKLQAVDGRMDVIMPQRLLAKTVSERLHPTPSACAIMSYLNQTLS